MIVTFYSLETFATTRQFEGPEGVAELNDDVPGEAWLEGGWLGTHYIDPETRQPRLLRRMVLEVSVRLVTGVVPGAEIRQDDDDEVTIAVDDTLELEADDWDDDVVVAISHPWYYPETVRVPLR